MAFRKSAGHAQVALALRIVGDGSRLALCAKLLSSGAVPVFRARLARCGRVYGGILSCRADAAARLPLVYVLPRSTRGAARLADVCKLALGTFAARAIVG